MPSSRRPAVLEAAAPGHVEQVRLSLFDLLTPEQVAELTAISKAIIAAAESPIGPGLACPLECDGDTAAGGDA